MTAKQHTSLTYENTFRRFVLSVLYLVTVPFILGGFFYDLQTPIKIIFLVICVLNIISIVIVHTIPVSYVKKLVKAYLFAMIILIFPATVLYLSIGIATPILWYLTIPVYIYAIHPEKKGLFMIGILFIIMLVSFALAFIIRYVYFDNSLLHFGSMNLIQALRSDIINGLSAFITVCFSLHYIHRFHQLRIEQLLENTGSTHLENEDNLLEIEDEDEYKYRQIYAQIEEYFEKKQPYLDPDFKMAQMAHELNINIVYLAKAIRMERNMNFNNFVNEYRIEKVKELMRNDSRKYTLKYIYLSAGFKYQSSFNKAFKQKEGITPSDYYRQNRHESIVEEMEKE